MFVAARSMSLQDGKDVNLISNGCEMLSRITGTGCMLNVAIATFLASYSPLLACIKATCYYELLQKRRKVKDPELFICILWMRSINLPVLIEFSFKIEVLG
ncbi:MAG: hydroxyethylthiazole kinase [Paraclostridium bifermentans]